MISFISRNRFINLRRRIFTTQKKSTQNINESIDNPNFKSLGLIDSLVNGLNSQKITLPTNVQLEFIPRLLNKENLVMSASTGSGKTLAYTLPIIQNMILEEQNGYIRQNHAPRGVILVPTRELAKQILIEIKNLSHYCKISSYAIVGGETHSKQTKNLQSKIDILIATPGRFLLHLAQKHFSVKETKYLVIDEVDTMFIQGFGPDLRKILASTFNNKNSYPQLIMASATITKAMRSLLDDTTEGFNINNLANKDDTENETGTKGNQKRIDAVQQLSEKVEKITPINNFSISVVDVEGVNCSLPNVTHDMEDIKGKDKVEVFESVLLRYHHKKWKTMIFCNTIDSCRAVAYKLDSLELISDNDRNFQTITSLSYHGELNSQDRTNNLELFRNDPLKQYLVCTDIAARGIDIPDVQHVIMFDFPLNPIDYLHRAGRTGRMGAKGLVTSLIAKRDKVLAKAIEDAIASGTRIDLLSSDKRHYQFPKNNSTSTINSSTGIKKILSKSRSNQRIVSETGWGGIVVKQPPRRVTSRTSKIVARRESDLKRKEDLQKRREQIQKLREEEKKRSKNNIDQNLNENIDDNEEYNKFWKKEKMEEQKRRSSKRMNNSHRSSKVSKKQPKKSSTKRSTTTKTSSKASQSSFKSKKSTTTK